MLYLSNIMFLLEKLFYFFVYNEIKIMIEEIKIFGKFADVD